MGCSCISPTQSLQLGKYNVLKQVKIAEGGYGEVWKCKASLSDNIYALKLIRLQNNEFQAMFHKQVRLLTKLSQSNVKGSITLKASNITMEGRHKVGCMLFEFGTITLLDELSSKHLSETQILTILKDVCESLTEIHTLGIYHLDLKPQNLILVNNRYKICDFGSAIDTKKKASSFIEYIETNSTLNYRSPEMIEPFGKVIGAASDIWMLGCITYLLTFRKHPFQGEGKLAIVSGYVRYAKEGFLTEITKEMLSLDYKSRPSANILSQKIQKKLIEKKI